MPLLRYYRRTARSVVDVAFTIGTQLREVCHWLEDGFVDLDQDEITRQEVHERPVPLSREERVAELHMFCDALLREASTGGPYRSTGRVSATHIRPSRRD